MKLDTVEKVQKKIESTKAKIQKYNDEINVLKAELSDLEKTLTSMKADSILTVASKKGLNVDDVIKLIEEQATKA